MCRDRIAAARATCGTACTRCGMRARVAPVAWAFRGNWCKRAARRFRSARGGGDSSRTPPGSKHGARSSSSRDTRCKSSPRERAGHCEAHDNPCTSGGRPARSRALCRGKSRMAGPGTAGAPTARDKTCSPRARGSPKRGSLRLNGNPHTADPERRRCEVPPLRVFRRNSGGGWAGSCAACDSSCTRCGLSGPRDRSQRSSCGRTCKRSPSR